MESARNVLVILNERVVDNCRKLRFLEDRFEFGSLVDDLVATLVDILPGLDALNIDADLHIAFGRKGRIQFKNLPARLEFALLERTPAKLVQCFADELFPSPFVLPNLESPCR